MLRTINLSSNVEPTRETLESVESSKISFKANSGKLERTPSQDEYNNGLSTGAKIGIGVACATVLAVVGDFIFAKGKHIKKLFGIAEKEAAKHSDDATRAATGGTTSTATEAVATHTESVVATLPKYSKEELEQIMQKKWKDLTPEEMSRIINSVIPDDQPLLKELLEYASKEPTLKNLLDETYTVKGVLGDSIKSLEDLGMNEATLSKIFGEKSFLKKPLKDIEMGEVLELLPDAPEEFKMLKEIKIVDFIESQGGKLDLGEHVIEINSSDYGKPAIDLIKDLIKNLSKIL